ncbi:MAG: hypothetical protein F6K48_03345 [Okeania sp. SIO3H1]|nr:hypothetical protein [Okeania sp. SIO3H1]
MTQQSTHHTDELKENKSVLDIPVEELMQMTLKDLHVQVEVHQGLLDLINKEKQQLISKIAFIRSKIKEENHEQS